VAVIARRISVRPSRNSPAVVVCLPRVPAIARREGEQRSSRGERPGIYDLDAGAVEVRQVPGGQCGAPGPANGRDQRVETGDRSPGSLAIVGDDRVLFCGCDINRQHLIFEGPEDIVGGGEEDLCPATVGKPGNAVPDLCERDGLP
jgi:hypothetical protein